MLKMLILLYADDTVIFSKTYSDMKHALCIFSDYCTKWGLTINEVKSKIVVFGRDRPNYIFQLNGKSLEKVKTFNGLSHKDQRSYDLMFVTRDNKL